MPESRAEIFAALRLAKRIWAVAAIHGESTRLETLHEALWPRLGPGDRLVYLGNYMGRGPDAVGVIDRLLYFRRAMLTLPGMEPGDVVYLRGAQEEMWQKLLQIQFASDPHEVLDWLLGHGIGATLEAYGASAQGGRQAFREGTLAVTRWTGELRAAMRRHRGHDLLLSALRRAAYTENHGLLFVHAGVDPHRPLGEQRDTLWWGSGYFDQMNEPFEDFRLVVRGYDRDRGGTRIGPVSATIDDGCGFGGALAACCFTPDGEVLDRIEA